MTSTPFHRRMLDLARDLSGAENHERFLGLSLEFLIATFRPDRVLWADIDLGGGRASGLLDATGALDAEFSQLLLLRGAEHPGISSYVEQPDDLTPRRLSDLVPGRVWMESELYREVFAPVGGRHQLSLVVDLQAARGIGWTMFRQTRDFTDDDVDRARLVLPLLTGFHRMFVRLSPAPPPVLPLTTDLTTREREVVHLLAGGLTAAFIGRRLGIRTATVRKHLEHIYAKFGDHDRVLVVNRARALGLLSEWPAGPDDPDRTHL